MSVGRGLEGGRRVERKVRKRREGRVKVEEEEERVGERSVSQTAYLRHFWV